MFITTLKSIFDIDNVGKRWPVRILYLVTVLLNAAIYFNPWADTDFTPLSNWMMSVYSLTENETEMAEHLMSSIPLSTGNIVFLATVLIGEMILITSAYIYAGIYVRQYRIEKISSLEDNPDSINYAVTSIPDAPIKIPKMIIRIIILVLVTSIVALPIITISFYFFILTMLGLPFVFTAPVAYLSGDKGLFKSIPYVAKMSLRYYAANMRGLALVIVVAIIVDFAVPYIANVSLTAYYILDAAITTWVFLSFARLAALSYCTMKDFPLTGARRPYAI